MLALPEAITVFNVLEVKEQLLSYLEKTQEEGSEAIFDAASLQDIDAAGIQLLLAAFKAFEAKSIPYRFINQGDSLKKLLALAGIDRFIYVN